jgi:hypothetical protein
MDFNLKHTSIIGSFASLCVLVSSLQANAASPVPKYNLERAEHNAERSTKLVLPYLFSTETMGLNLGVGAMVNGAFQEQLTIGATAYGGAESYGGAVGFWNLQIPGTERWFATGLGFYGYFPEQTAHSATGNEPIPNSRPLPGSSYSSADDAVVGAGFSNTAELKIEYVLPLGHHTHFSTLQYKSRGGLLVDAPKHQSWNPLTTGSSLIMLRGFSKYESYESEDLAQIEGDSGGIELGFLYDNTDFVPNPSRGSRQNLTYTHDGKIFGESRSWNSVEFSTSHYWDIGASDWARQQVLAFNFWTAYSPSWTLVQDDANDSRYVENAPPYSLGASLGGWDRMRGYSSNRFHDKAAIYSTLEYRYTLDYNPTNDMTLLRLLQIDWFQLVPFVEVGEIAPEYSASELFSNMKYDAGVSFRAFAAGLVVRADYAHSPEGSALWVMVGHPF